MRSDAGPAPLAFEADLRAEMPGVVSGAPEPSREAVGGAPEVPADRARAEVRAGSLPASDARSAQPVRQDGLAGPEPGTRPSLAERPEAEPAAPSPLARPSAAPSWVSQRSARKTSPERAPAAPASARAAASRLEFAADAEVVPADVPVSIRVIEAIRTRAPLAGAAAERRERAESRTRDSSPRSEARPDSSGAPARGLPWSATEPEQAPLLVPPAMPASARPRPRASSDVPTPEAAADAAIEVTIGRIEVRAAPAPSGRVPQRPARRSPSDLEIYLRQKVSRRP